MSLPEHEEAFIRALAEARLYAVEVAVLEIGMTGGGVVAMEHPTPMTGEFTVYKVRAGCTPIGLPNPRVEWHVPDLRGLVYRED